MENTPPRIERCALKIGLRCKIPTSANLSILGGVVSNTSLLSAVYCYIVKIDSPSASL